MPTFRFLFFFIIGGGGDDNDDDDHDDYDDGDDDYYHYNDDDDLTLLGYLQKDKQFSLCISHSSFILSLLPGCFHPVRLRRSSSSLQRQAGFAHCREDDKSFLMMIGDT